MSALHRLLAVVLLVPWAAVAQPAVQQAGTVPGDASSSTATTAAGTSATLGSWMATMLSNTRLAKTANYTLANADKGKTIALGGNAFFTLTVGAASGFDANFMAVVSNEDVWGTGRGKKISINGMQDFILFPGTANAANNDPEQGNSFILYNQNNVWHVLKNGRAKLPAGAFTLNVDPTLGSDTAADGLATGAGAFHSLDHAHDVLLDQTDFNATASGQTQTTILLATGATTSERLHWATHSLLGAQGYAALTVDLGGGKLTDATANQAALQMYMGESAIFQNGTIESTGSNEDAVQVQDGALMIVGTGLNVKGAANGLTTARNGHIVITAFAGAAGLTFSAIGATGNPLSATDNGSIAMGGGGTINLGASLSGSAFSSATKNSSIDLNNPTFATNGFTYTGNRSIAADNASVSYHGATGFGSGDSLSRGGTFDGDSPSVAAGYSGGTTFASRALLYGQGGGVFGSIVGGTSVPTAGGTVSPGQMTPFYYIAPAGTLATLTYNLPLMGDGSCHTFVSSQVVTALTLGTANYTGTAGISAPGALAVNTPIQYCVVGTTAVRVQ